MPRLPSRGKLTSLALLVAWLILHLLGSLPYQNKLQTLLFDGYQRISPRQRLSAPVTIIDIDEASLKRYGQWPWPRSLLAMLLTDVEAMKPAAIGLDLILPEQDRSSPCAVARYIPTISADLQRRVCKLPSNDELLAKVLKNGPTVLGVAGLDNGPPLNPSAPPARLIGGDPSGFLRRFPGALTNFEGLDAAAKGHAIISVDMDDGVVQRVLLAAKVGETLMPSLPVEMLRLAAGVNSFTVKSAVNGVIGVAVGDLFIPTQPQGDQWVHYSHHDPSRFISAAELLDGDTDAVLLTGKLVLIGVTGLGLVDFPTTALGERMPGVEIHAQLLESIFDQNILLRPKWAKWVEGALTVLLGLIIIARVSRTDPLRSVAIILGIQGAYLLMGYILYLNQNWLLDGASPVLTTTLLLGGMLTDALINSAVQRKALRKTLEAQRLSFAKQAGELEAARRIQTGMLPNPKSVIAGETRVDLAARMEPAKSVGGDLYDFFKLDDDNVFFVIGDVCGKGVPASLFMAISKTLIKSLALRRNLILSKLVSEANVEISRENSEMLFVTAFLGILNLQTGELTYCNAGHEMPMLVSRDGSPRLLNILGGPAICIIDDYAYTVTHCQIEPGEFICLVSDGITEAHNPDGEIFGNKRLNEALLAAASADSAESFVELVCHSVYRFTSGAEPFDDLTMLAIRWLGPSNNSDGNETRFSKESSI